MGAERKSRLGQSASRQRDQETSSPAQQPDMAPWGDAKLVFCILFITCCYCWMVTVAEVPVDCCLSVANKTIDKTRVAGYRRQIEGQGCHIDAMIFVTRGNRKLCVPSDEPWVHDLVKHVDTLKKFCKKHNYKPKRCHDLNRE